MPSATAKRNQIQTAKTQIAAAAFIKTSTIYDLEFCRSLSRTPLITESNKFGFFLTIGLSGGAPYAGTGAMGIAGSATGTVCSA
jgi:hypothetical protein